MFIIGILSGFLVVLGRALSSYLSMNTWQMAAWTSSSSVCYSNRRLMLDTLFSLVFRALYDMLRKFILLMRLLVHICLC